MHKEFHKNVLNRLKFFPLISKEHPFVVDNLREAIKEDRKKITFNLTTKGLVYKCGVFRESAVLRDCLLADCTLTARHGLRLHCHFIL